MIDELILILSIILFFLVIDIINRLREKNRLFRELFIVTKMQKELAEYGLVLQIMKQNTNSSLSQVDLEGVEEI